MSASLWRSKLREVSIFKYSALVWCEPRPGVGLLRRGLLTGFDLLAVVAFFILNAGKRPRIIGRQPQTKPMQGSTNVHIVPRYVVSVQSSFSVSAYISMRWTRAKDVQAIHSRERRTGKVTITDIKERHYTVNACSAYTREWLVKPFILVTSFRETYNPPNKNTTDKATLSCQGRRRLQTNGIGKHKIAKSRAILTP